MLQKSVRAPVVTVAKSARAPVTVAAVGAKGISPGLAPFKKLFFYFNHKNYKTKIASF